MKPTDHAAAIATLPDETVMLVLDALCVRAMDFVCARIGDDYVSDLSADTARELLYADMEPWAEPPVFDPDHYRQTLAILRSPDPLDLSARFARARAYVDTLDGVRRTVAEAYLRHWRGMTTEPEPGVVDPRLIAILRGEE